MSKYITKKEKTIINNHYNDDVNIEFVGQGWHNRLFKINNKEVFRLTKTEHGKEKMLLYDSISKHININLPRPIFKSIKIIDDGLYKAYATYDYFNGKAKSLNKLKRESIIKLASSMSSIHHIDDKWGLGKISIVDELQEEFLNLKNHVFCFLNLEEQNFITTLYEDYFKSGIPSNIASCLIHGDLNKNNILQDEDNNITAIIDWDGIHYNDPIKDFCRFTPTLFYKLLDNYPNKDVLGEDIEKRYNFYRVRKKAYSMYYSATIEKYKDKHEKHMKDFRKTLKPTLNY